MASRKRDAIIMRLPDRLGWMVTFSDMVTLLLTFFIMLIATSSMDAKALRESFGYFSSVAGPMDFSQEKEAGILTPVVKPVPEVIELKAEHLSRMLVIALKNQGIPDAQGRGLELFDVVETSRGLAIRIPGDILFAEGSFQVRKEAQAVLRAAAAGIRATDATVSIDGHTDNRGDDRKNWRLSLQRATSVADYFVYSMGMPPGRFCVAGYGAQRPLATNDTDTGRSKNRRVEIILLKDRL